MLTSWSTSPTLCRIWNLGMCNYCIIYIQACQDNLHIIHVRDEISYYYGALCLGVPMLGYDLDAPSIDHTPVILLD